MNNVNDNDNDNIVELIDENGDSVFFEYLMTLTYKEQDYIILATLEDNESVVILRVEQDDEGYDMYVGIEDKEELDEIFKVYTEILNSDLYD
ncbi:MAG TPA: DUF1292 domain-containing protein [Clostridiales bacterium]|nr:DUF1292 domain-containing protein [Clostridiales bacterium]